MKDPRRYPNYLIGLALVGLMGWVTLSGHLWHRLSVSSNSAPAPSQLRQQPESKVQETLSNLPLYFVENQGQVDARVAYYVQGRDKTLYFTAQGLTFALHGKDDRPTASEVDSHKVALLPVSFNAEPNPQGAPPGWALKLDFVGANPNVQPVGKDQTSATVSYFKGPQAEWKAGLKTYATVVYPELWPGIDLIYTGTANRLKYSFLVKPGADPSQIKLAYRGATATKLNQVGELKVTTPVGGFKDDQRATPDCDYPAPVSREHDSDYCQQSATDYRSDFCQPPLGEIEAGRRSEHPARLPSKEASHQKV